MTGVKLLEMSADFQALEGQEHVLINKITGTFSSHSNTSYRAVTNRIANNCPNHVLLTRSELADVVVAPPIESACCARCSGSPRAPTCRMEMAARVTQLQQHHTNRLEPSPELANDLRECNSAPIAATTAEAPSRQV